MLRLKKDYNNYRNYALPVNRKTALDVTTVDVKFGEKDGEIIVKCKATIKFKNKAFEPVFNLVKHKFPFISKSGVFMVEGRAVCGDEEFNFDKGKYIAETRAQRKAYKVCQQYFTLLNKELTRINDFVEVYKDGCESCYIATSEHIDEIK